MKRAVLICVIAAVLIGVALVAVTRNNTNNSAQQTAPTSNQTLNQEDNSAQQQTEAPQTQPASANSVEIRDFAFSPAKITVKKGTTVTWTNRDSQKHDITPDQPNEKFTKSQLLDTGESYSLTFTDEGTYTYHCSPHPHMKGMVEVVSD